MTTHKVADAFPNAGSTNATAIQQALAAGGAAAVVPEIVIARNSGTIFCRDPLNSDPHNGVTVIVSLDGKGYRAPLAPQSFVNVLEIRNSPPTSPAPAAGDRYIVGVAPTGAWASNAEDLTYYDGLQWVFVNPVIGQSVYVRNVEGKYHWGESGAWLPGDGAFTVEAEGVGARELEFPWGMVVESKTSTPPASSPTITEGVKYIVGVSATGAWSGHDTEVAEADGAGGWTFFDPYDGATVLNRATKSPVRFDATTGLWVSAGGVWVGSTGPIISRGNSSTSGTLVGSGAYSYSASVAPAGQIHRFDDVYITHRAKKPNAWLRITYSVESWQNSDVVALFRDAESTALVWLPYNLVVADDYKEFTLWVQALDTASHDYHIAFYDSAGNASFVTNRVLFIEEMA